ncbi:uncharacterized protein LOC126739457 isoform X3 [Anthonomus grandis grandis]|uniref:uncharacterized protein LOC126739457 isoform X3 n=1 Tax=Anthonomus grandis grandis TaxID=2921223 RepID=UPI002165473B|nr:uncharacterized protein LOC126739457 isoform X3 [Anthonomus grandis grandis]
MYKINQTTLFGIDEKLLGMEMERNIRDLAKVHSSQPNKSTSDQNPNQGIATLIVMIVVLTIIILFCCFSAPGIRGLCQKYIFRSCRYDDPSADNVYTRRYYSQTDLTSVITHQPKTENVEVKS